MPGQQAALFGYTRCIDKELFGLNGRRGASGAGGDTQEGNAQFLRAHHDHIEAAARKLCGDGADESHQKLSQGQEGEKCQNTNGRNSLIRHDQSIHNAAAESRL